MKKTVEGIVLAVILVFSAGAFAGGKAGAKMIEFPKGSKVAVEKSTFVGGAWHEYELAVKPQQTVKIVVTPKKAKGELAIMEILDSKGMMLNEGTISNVFEMTSGADDIIRINLFGPDKVPFTLEVKVNE